MNYSKALKKILSVTLGLFFVVGLQQAQALPIPTGELIYNGGFGTNSIPQITGWDKTGTVNARSSLTSNGLNKSTGNTGFNNFFNSSFAALGSAVGNINSSPNAGTSSISQTFNLPDMIGNDSIMYYDLTISFQTVFNGRDSNNPSTVHDIFSATLNNYVLFSQDSSLFPDAWSTTANNQLANNPYTGLILGLLPGDYTLTFTLIEDGTLSATSTSFTNTAAGIDNITVTANGTAMVPEPGTILLLGGGFFALGLFGWNRKRS